MRHKWKTIRDGYIKYKKQLKQSEDSGKKVIEYIWSAQLSFLDGYNVNRRTNTHLTYAQQPQVQLFEESNESAVSSHSPTPNQWEAEDEPPSKRKRTIEQGDVEQILNFISSVKTKSNDAVDHLFMSYAETFKKFSPRRQAEMKIELAKLFSIAELNELQNADDSQPGSSTSPTEYLYSIKRELSEGHLA